MDKGVSGARTWRVPRVVVYSLRGGGLLRVLANQREQLVFLVWLTHVLVHAELHRVVAMFIGRTRRDHDDRDVLGLRICTHIAREFEAIHARHFDIEQDDVRFDILQL
jgi:hypothetical protein